MSSLCRSFRYSPNNRTALIILCSIAFSVNAKALNCSDLVEILAITAQSNVPMSTKDYSVAAFYSKNHFLFDQAKRILGKDADNILGTLGDGAYFHPTLANMLGKLNEMLFERLFMRSVPSTGPLESDISRQQPQQEPIDGEYKSIYSSLPLFYHTKSGVELPISPPLYSIKFETDYSLPPLARETLGLMLRVLALSDFLDIHLNIQNFFNKDFNANEKKLRVYKNVAELALSISDKEFPGIPIADAWKMAIDRLLESQNR